MQGFIQAKPDDASCLVDLYARAFKATGFAKLAALDNRNSLVLWLEELCSEGKIWLRRDTHGPTVLGHIDEERNEVITIVTRNDVEGRGEATAMLAFVRSQSVSDGSPCSQGGQSVARRCGFSPSNKDPVLWVRGPE